MARGRELSWMLIDSNEHKVIRVGCSDGPLELPEILRSIEQVFQINRHRVSVDLRILFEYP